MEVSNESPKLWQYEAYVQMLLGSASDVEWLVPAIQKALRDGKPVVLIPPEKGSNGHAEPTVPELRAHV